MNVIQSATPVTYGGEVETLVVERESGRVAPVERDLARSIEAQIKAVAPAMELDYDAAQHILELRVGVATDLPALVQSIRQALSTLITALDRHSSFCLLSTAYHPFEDPAAAYRYVTPRPMYSLVQGPLPSVSHPDLSVLARVYPSDPSRGRGWDHKLLTLATAIHPWNSLDLDQAAAQLSVIQSTGWLFNLLTANSPFAYGRRSGKRDYRLEVWPQLMASSRYRDDRYLYKNLPERPRRLIDYYRHVFSHQRPLITSSALFKQGGYEHNAKTVFRAVAQPEDTRSFTVLDYLQAAEVCAIDIETGSQVTIQPCVAHLFNGFDFFYCPRYGARLRLALPQAGRIDPRRFARSIIEGDEETFRRLLLEGGLEDGYLCLEGRSPATVLPTRDHPGWERLAIPFVLQTALLRAHREVAALFEGLRLTWEDLSERLPTLTNDCEYGFEATINDINVTELAQRVWAIARCSLADEELALVGDEIEAILGRRQAAAEEQLAFVAESRNDPEVALQRLVAHLQVTGLECLAREAEQHRSML